MPEGLEFGVVSEGGDALSKIAAVLFSEMTDDDMVDFMVEVRQAVL